MIINLKNFIHKFESGVGFEYSKYFTRNMPVDEFVELLSDPDYPDGALEEEYFSIAANYIDDWCFEDDVLDWAQSHEDADYYIQQVLDEGDITDDDEILMHAMYYYMLNCFDKCLYDFYRAFLSKYVLIPMGKTTIDDSIFTGFFNSLSNNFVSSSELISKFNNYISKIKNF